MAYYSRNFFAQFEAYCSCSLTFFYFSLYSCLKKDIPALYNYLLEAINISP